MATIKDVAKRAGVSISTVSHVINHTKNVSASTTRHVEQAIKDLNYKTNVFARNLKSQHTKQIGVIVLDMCGLFSPYIIKEICRIANEDGYTVTLLDSNGNFDLERQAISTLIESSVDGIILSSVIPTAQKESYAQELLELLSSGSKTIPLVMLERDFSAFGIDSICTDTYTGALKAMKHLIDIGCQNIGHISTPMGLEGRYLAYRTMLEENGLEYNDNYLERGDFSHESGYKCMKKILKNAHPLDGVFVANDQMAVGAIQAIHEAGFSIPSDIKLIGFDDVFICDTLNPPLSSIHIDKKMLGQKSITLLLDRIQNGPDKFPYKEVMESSLIIRDSTVRKNSCANNNSPS